MNQAVGPAQVYERAEVGQPGDPAFDDIAHLHPLEEFGLQNLPGFAGCGPLGQDEAAAVGFHLDDFGHDFVAHRVLPRGGGRHAAPHDPMGPQDVRHGHEAPQAAKAHHHPAFVVRFDGGAINFAFFLEFAGFVPIFLFQRLPIRKLRRTVGVHALYEDRDLCTLGQLGALFFGQAFQFLRGDQAVHFGAQVDPDALVAYGGDDTAVYSAAHNGRAGEGGRLQQFFHRRFRLPFFLHLGLGLEGSGLKGVHHHR